MKKSFLVMMVSGAILMTGALTHSASAAVDISVGVAGWGGYWDPFFRDVIKFNLPDGKTTLKPGAIGGPIVSVQLTDRITISGVFMLGEYSLESEGPTGDIDVDGIPDKAIVTINSTRYDLDTTLNYKLNKYFKVFGGLKYLGFSYDLKFVVERSLLGKLDAGDDHVSNTGWGGGAGLSFSYPILDNLFLLCNVSGLDIPATWKQDNYPKKTFNAYGYNGALSLAYYFADPGITLSLGGRYQGLYYKGSNSSAKEDTGLNKKWDKFYGIMFSAIYTFSVGGN